MLVYQRVVPLQLPNGSIIRHAPVASILMRRAILPFCWALGGPKIL